MALMACIGSRIARDSMLIAAEQAVKEGESGRLESLLTGPGPGGADGLTVREVTARHLLHQAAWLGHTTCVKLLLKHGAPVDQPHRKNGCTPLHMVHLCTIDNTDPARTVRALIEAGADINSVGSNKCGRHSLYHAIQYQRLDCVQVLLSLGARVTLQSVLVAIDVSNPQILSLLLKHGAECGPPLDAVDGWWGRPLQRLIEAPSKCARESYRQLVRLLTEATVSCQSRASAPTFQAELSVADVGVRGHRSTASCLQRISAPSNIVSSRNATATQSNMAAINLQVSPAFTHNSSESRNSSVVEAELKTLCRDNPDIAQFLLVTLVRNGFRVSTSCIEALQRTAATPGTSAISSTAAANIQPLLTQTRSTPLIDWVENYYRFCPPSLSDLTVRCIRSCLVRCCHGNIVYGASHLGLPSRLVALVTSGQPTVVPR